MREGSMERHLDQDLEQIRQQLLRMGGEVEAMVSGAMQALVDRNVTQAEAIRSHDRDVDRLEKEIDEYCARMLATRQPTASDLRFLVSVMKIVNDLERVGDSAVNIAQSVIVLNEEPQLKPYVDLPRLSDLVRRMVRDSLDAFVRRDARLAVAVCRRDDEIDALYKQLFRELLTYMIEDPQSVNRALHLLLIARNLERIADHATNVSEDVVYYVEGRDIRHEKGVT
ncbi:MAG: phosphate signaling complex protein PhoU, partial [Thermoanaerobaculia bacterium]